MKRTIFAVLIGSIIAFASGAQADFNNSFSYGKRLDRRSTLELGVVRAEADGVVEIYSYHRAEQGRLLGTKQVRGGANRNVHVYVRTRPTTDVLAVLRVGGRVVAMKEYEIDRRQDSGLSRRNRAGRRR